MAIKRKILSFTDFKKGKNSLEKPVKHPIKESEVLESIYAVSDDLKSNFRSWEHDHDNAKDAEELFNILTAKYPNEDERKIKKMAYDWVGYEEKMEENTGIFPEEFWDKRAAMKKGDKIQFISQEPIIDRGAGEGLGKVLADKKGTIVDIDKEGFTADIEVDGKVYKNVIDVVFDIIDESEVFEKLSKDAQEFISKKIKFLIGEGRPQKQAEAMAYSYARRAGYDVPSNENNISYSAILGDPLISYLKTLSNVVDKKTNESMKILRFENFINEDVFSKMSQKMGTPEEIQAEIDKLEKENKEGYANDIKKLKLKLLTVKSLKNESEEMNELLAKDMEPGELVKDKVYKIFSREKNGAMEYSAARFDGLDKAKGNKFTLINKPKELEIFIKPEEVKNYIFTPSSFKKK